jgi:hypothetical protein
MNWGAALLRPFFINREAEKKYLYHRRHANK